MKKILLALLISLLGGSACYAETKSKEELIQLAIDCNDDDQYQQALDYSLEVLKKDKRNAQAYCQAGIALRKLNRNKEALEKLKLAEQYAGQDKELLSNVYSEMGFVYENMNNCLQAQKMFKKSIEIDRSLQEAPSTPE